MHYNERSNSNTTSKAVWPFPLWRYITLFLVLAVALLATLPKAEAARANLPTANEVIPGAASPIDGEYRISTLNKRVLLDRGRAIVLEGWKHLFLFDVEPGMVVIRDIRSSGNGSYTGRDLPLEADWAGQYDKRSGKISVTVSSGFGPVRYDLIPVNAVAEPVDPEPRFVRVPANRMGDAKLPTVRSCPGRQSYLSRGACWVCPDGYKRAKLTREMDHPEACQKRGFNSKVHTKARRLGQTHARCPSSQFHVAEQGVNGCYRCPPGSTRDTSVRNSTTCLSQQ